MANPNMIGGGRYTRGEVSGDKRRFEAKKIDVKALLLRLWKYLGRHRLLLVLAMVLSVSSSVLSLYGPKLSGQAINAIELGTGKVDFDTVFRCCALMAVCYFASCLLSYLLHVVVLRLSRFVARQMRHDVFLHLLQPNLLYQHT